MNLESFIAKAKARHSDRYDYSQAVYVGSQTKLIIFCPEHGPFTQRPAVHLFGQGCPACGVAQRATSRRASLATRLAQAAEIHQGKYDYSTVVPPANCREKVEIICPDHGPFWQSFNVHLRGVGCPSCGLVKIAQKRSKPFDDFLSEAQRVHGDKYDYTQVQYTNASTKISILCRGCNQTFWQTPNNHVCQAQGCPACGAKRSIESRTKTTEQFIAQAVAVHGSTYDYSLVDYVKALSDVTIVCKVHGAFQQNANLHLKGRGCRQCGIERRALNSRHDTEWFIEEARKIHVDRFDYSTTKYVTSSDKVTIVCKEHGAIHIAPYDHLRGPGCPRCSHASAGAERRIPFDEFKSRAMEVHGERYSYMEEGYLDSKTPCTILCAAHGSFLQIPNDHLGGHGCKACSGSNGENEVAAFLDKLGVAYIRWDRDVLGGKELDFLLPNLGLAIEYNGLRYHSSWAEGTRGRSWVINHQRHKQDECRKKGVRLLHYFEDEWQDKKAIVQQQLALATGRYSGRKLYARDTETSPVPWEEAKAFLELHHLQGAGTPGSAYGLRHEDELVAVMVFTSILSRRGVKADPTAWELARFACSGQIVGGASKLLSKFRSEHPQAAQVVSYSDNRWASGTMYAALGFKAVEQVPVDYMYVKTNVVKRYHKSSFRREALARKFPDKFDPALSERENCHNLGFYQIFNCGLTKWTLTLP